VIHATHLINKTHSNVLEKSTTYELVYKEQLSLKKVRVFGSLYFVYSLQRDMSKLDSRARKCVFLGYKTRMKGYDVLDIHNIEIFVSRNMIFYKHIFPCFKYYKCNNNENNMQLDNFDYIFESIKK